MTNIVNSDNVILYLAGSVEVKNGKLILTDPSKVRHMDDIYEHGANDIDARLQDGLYSVYEVFDYGDSEITGAYTYIQGLV